LKKCYNIKKFSWDAVKLNNEKTTHQVTHQVEKLLQVLDGEMSKKDLMHKIDISDKVTFRENYIQPALEQGFIEMTQPDSPTSPTQKYKLTPKGKEYKRNY